MNKLYPLKFRPVFKEKVWGGSQLRTQLGLDFSPLPNCGEAWMLSGVANNETAVSDGWLAGNDLNELVEIYMDELVGEKSYDEFGDRFPLLIKLIDSNDWLSVQVHPDDDYAKKNGMDSGKTEMWYVLHANDGSELIAGFNKRINKDLFLRHIHEKSLKDILNFEKVSACDVFFMPAKRLHALGPGILLVEIQQTSDHTFRIYDWDRVNASGKSRTLHLQQALEVVDFEACTDSRIKYEIQENRTVPLVSCLHFTTNLLQVSRPLSRNYSELDSFVVFFCSAGMADIRTGQDIEKLKAGECILIPACIDTVDILPVGNVSLLETYIQ